MEEAAKAIKTLADQILPKQPYYLSRSHTSRYPIPAAENIIDEKIIRPLQYLTFVGGEADRGVLITRAYFTVREEPNSASNALMPTTLKIDPNKPRKKVSLKDYKNKKVEGDSTPKGEKGKETPNGLATIKEAEEFKKPTEPAPREMDNRRDAKKPIANAKTDATRRPSPSPERRKRAAEVDEGSKPIKRARVEDATVNGTAPRPLKNSSSQKPVKNVPLGKSEAKDARPSIAINGRPASSNSALRGASPKFTPQTNGYGKTNGSQAAHRRTVSNGEPMSKTVPKLLSPLHISEFSVDKTLDVLKGSATESRSSPKKRPVEASNSKAQPKNLRDESEPLPSTKKRKVVPALLSPTLPAIVMSELAKRKKSATPSKEVSQKSSQASDSSAIGKRPAKSMREDTIHVDSKREEPKQQVAAASKEEPMQPATIIKEERKSFVITIKYNKRRCGKTIERLLNLPAGVKRQIDGSRRDDGRPRESSGSVEPGTARKRPRTTGDGAEASKRPRTSEALRPSTPPRQAAAMSRIASNSSQAGTPGATNGLTPSAQFSADKRREPIPPEKLQRAQRLHSSHKFFMELGTKLKHERDAIMKNNKALQEREHQTAVAAGIQSLLMYMYAVKLQSDALDMERLPRRPQSWREVLPLFRVVRSDCSRNPQLLALLLRLQGICTSYMGRALWFLPNEADALLSTSKEEADIWRSADYARRKLGVYDGSSSPSDGGVVGKLIDRLGPWTTPEELIPITLEVMRNVIGINGPWKLNDELARLGRSISNGMTG